MSEMKGASYLGCSIEGTAHGTYPMTGQIYSDCSVNVFINGIAAAFVGSKTIEYDAYHSGPGYGEVSQGSSRVFVNGNRIAYNGCEIAPHSGSGNVTEGSNNVFVSV